MDTNRVDTHVRNLVFHSRLLGSWFNFKLGLAKVFLVIVPEDRDRTFFYYIIY